MHIFERVRQRNVVKVSILSLLILSLEGCTPPVEVNCRKSYRSCLEQLGEKKQCRKVLKVCRGGKKMGKGFNDIIRELE